MLNEETLYARFISGELSQKEIESLKANGDWDKLSKIAEFTGELELPSFDTKRGFDVLVERKNERTKSEPRVINFKLWLGIAACFLLFTTTWMWFSSSTTNVISPYGQTAQLVLPDDSKVILNAGSTVEYQKESWDSNRKVLLDGEAFFKVSPGNSFEVETALGSVNVLGTEFNVKARVERFEVECYEGKVQVNRNLEKLTLSSNEAIYDENLNVVQIQEETRQPSWMKGRSDFSNYPLLDVLRELERQYDIKVICQENPSFTGSFSHGNLKLATEQISKSLGLNVIISKDRKEVQFTK